MQVICLIAHWTPPIAIILTILDAHYPKVETDSFSNLSLAIFTIMQVAAITHILGMSWLIWRPNSLLLVISNTSYFYESRYISSCRKKVGLIFMFLILTGLHNGFQSGYLMECEVLSVKFIWSLLILFGYPCSYVLSCGVIFVIGLSFNSVRIDFFSKMIHATNTLNFREGLLHYVELRSFTEECNRVFGLRFLFYSILTVIYYAYLPEIFLTSKSSNILTVVAYLSTGILMWLSLAEFHRSVCLHLLKLLHNWIF